MHTLNVYFCVCVNKVSLCTRCANTCKVNGNAQVNIHERRLLMVGSVSDIDRAILKGESAIFYTRHWCRVFLRLSSNCRQFNWPVRVRLVSSLLITGGDGLCQGNTSSDQPTPDILLASFTGNVTSRSSLRGIRCLTVRVPRVSANIYFLCFSSFQAN